MTMTTPPAQAGTAQQAERLWVTAHEHVRRGDFAAATRDLSQAFAILQALKDPRLAEVHKRWTEVHKLYVEDGARAVPSAAAQKAAPAPNLEAEAEAAANAGNLEQAIQLYEKALAKQPQNELVAERLVELRAARPRAAELIERPTEQPRPAPVVDEAAQRDAAIAVAAAEEEAPVDAVAAAAATIEANDAVVAAASVVEHVPVVAVPVVGGKEDLELEAGPDLDIHDRQTLVPQAASTNASTAPREAPPMDADDAPIGMGSLDVAIDMGEAVSHFVADELPVQSAPAASSTPAPAASSGAVAADSPLWSSPAASLPASAPVASSEHGDDAVEILEELLKRVHHNRRFAA